MSTKQPDGLRLGYLLGTLTAEEAALVEREILGSDAAFAEIEALEDEVFQDYAQDRLADGDRARFEARFLQTPEGQRRLAQARRLQGRLATGPPAEARGWPARFPGWLPVAAVLALAALGAWLASTSDRPVGDRTAGAGASPAPIAKSPSSDRASPPPPGLVVTLALAPGLSREGATARRATVSHDATVLRLVLSLPAGPVRAEYGAILRSAESPNVWSRDRVTISQRTAMVEIPAGRVPEGDYELVLLAGSGVQRAEVAEYAFGVLRE